MRTLFSVFLFLVSFVSYSQEPEVLYVCMNDGTTLSFSLKGTPLLTFDAENVLITSQDANASLVRSEVNKFYFSSDGPTGILSAVMPDAPSIEGDCMNVDGLVPGAAVNIYSANGQKVLTLVADSSGTAVASLASLERGVYVVEYSGVTFKLMKK